MAVVNPILADTPQFAFQRGHHRPIRGWALVRAALVDSESDRGFLVDLMAASTLRRQTVFAVLSAVGSDEVEEFLNRLEPAGRSFGVALITCPAEKLLATAFEGEGKRPVRPLLRALAGLGDNPLPDPALYRRLYEIMALEGDGLKAHALRYCRPLTGVAIEVVDVLHEGLLDPEIVKRAPGVEWAERLNAAVQLVQSCCSHLTMDAMRTAIRQSRSAKMDRLVGRWIAKADRFPPPPLPPAEDVRALSTAAAMIECGRDFGNCLKTASKIGEALLGYAYHYVVDHRADDGTVSQVIVELTPLSTGDWVIGTIEVHQRNGLSTEVRTAVIKRMAALGAVTPHNPNGYSQARRLHSILGIYHLGLADLEADRDGEDGL